MAKALGGYMILKNTGENKRYLVAATAAHFDEVTLHRSVLEGGFARMVHQDEITIPPGGRIEFRPGDYHLMLMRPDQRFVVGDQINITLKFKNGEEISLPYRVLKGMNMGSDTNHECH